jgi:isopentenyl-diphosphate Delta-isomerase
MFLYTHNKGVDMSSEMIDVLDGSGKPTGKKMLLSEAHREGVFHRTSHVWIYNSKGEVLLQKRAAGRLSFPGLWDISTAGHVSAGQTYEEAAIREAFEEIGIKVEAWELMKAELRKLIQDGPRADFHNREFIQVYLLKRDLDIGALKLQKEEVECVKFVSLDVFESEVRDPLKIKQYTPLKDYFLDVISKIRKEIKKG